MKNVLEVRKRWNWGSVGEFHAEGIWYPFSSKIRLNHTVRWKPSANPGTKILFPLPEKCYVLYSCSLMPSPLRAPTAGRLGHLAVVATTVLGHALPASAFVFSFASALSSRTSAVTASAGKQTSRGLMSMGSPPLGAEERVVIVGGGIGERDAIAGVKTWRVWAMGLKI